MQYCISRSILLYGSAVDLVAIFEIISFGNVGKRQKQMFSKENIFE